LFHIGILNFFKSYFDHLAQTTFNQETDEIQTYRYGAATKCTQHGTSSVPHAWLNFF